MDPGTYISIAQVAFEGACLAVKTFRHGLHFSEDAERLVLALEVERFRLHIWGENAGLAPPNEQPATLPDRLLPICEILREYLSQIETQFRNADILSTRYGLSETEAPPTKSALVRQLVERMQRSIQTSGIKLSASSKTEDDDDKEEVGSGDTADAGLGTDYHGLDLPKERRKTSTWKKVRWAVRDLGKFESLVKDLAQRINKLNELMTETQLRKTREDNYRINMVVVGSAVDEASLELIRAAVRGDPDTSQVRAAVERKALTVAGPSASPRVIGTARLQALSLDEFILPSGFADLKRFITFKHSSSATDRPYLLERKTFDSSMLPADMALLSSRIQRLVLLLQKPKTPDFRTSQAEGCIKDPTHSCWWIVFRYPLQPAPQPDLTRRQLRSTKGAPISLLTLLQPANKFRPPLEQRLILASTLCSTLSELYLSGWLHKGVRSENILFPLAGPSIPAGTTYTPEEMNRILSAPLVAGFDYSRHETERATIDRARNTGDVGVAIYRHPHYQGEAAQGYKVQYDIYSVGLVLVEIALWMPLSSFLEATAKKRNDRGAAAPRDLIAALQLGGGKQATTGSVELSGDMKIFHEPHAMELKKRLMARVEAELAFRVGSPFYRAVKFCLEFADRNSQADPAVDGPGEVSVHPAMEFYDKVVVPLAGLASP
ncbi:prion-inhibition and propagation-domain-containing protein [Achaetomium macrosporum]|uniref:Prion-inhibition and propagation-domain-containing protein n=1 Tax=Achaetomium macrosporum TaxID=79813 RepID=A0AAN7H9B2_9PEZI|nr:prion-inhibition and propagation-domain-containing protein [Achaetomium macrosporum]